MEGKKQLKPINYVHDQIIHSQNIYRERKFEGSHFKTQYTFSPYTCNIFLY
jgi:hypothetical protein